MSMGQATHIVFDVGYFVCTDFDETIRTLLLHLIVCVYTRTLYTRFLSVRIKSIFIVGPCSVGLNSWCIFMLVLFFEKMYSLRNKRLIVINNKLTCQRH